MPFTTEQFLGIFAEYNQRFAAVAVGLWLLTAISAVKLRVAPTVRTHRFVFALLAFHWIWIAGAYHALLFATINALAWDFAFIFFVEGGLLLWSGTITRHLKFSPRQTGSISILAWSFVIYGLAYPGLALLGPHDYPQVPTFGLPCPSTILTIGFLLLAEPPVSTSLIIIPIIWSVIGGTGAVLFQVAPDLMLPVAGLCLFVVSARGFSRHRPLWL